MSRCIAYTPPHRIPICASLAQNSESARIQLTENWQSTSLFWINCGWLPRPGSPDCREELRTIDTVRSMALSGCNGESRSACPRHFHYWKATGGKYCEPPGAAANQLSKDARETTDSDQFASLCDAGI